MPIVLTPDQAWWLQEELINGYDKPLLHAARRERGKTCWDGALEKPKVKQLCAEGSKAVLPNYGFEPTRKCVQESLKAFTRPSHGTDLERMERDNYLSVFVDPDKQGVVGKLTTLEKGVACITEVLHILGDESSQKLLHKT